MTNSLLLTKFIAITTILLTSTIVISTPAYATDDVIAFQANPDNSNRNIYTMNIDGSGVTQLTSGTDHYQEPAISPDGTKIAYIRQAADFSYAHVWIMNIDGTNPVQVTTHIPSGGSTNFYSSPTWSPDGTKLVVTRFGGGFGSYDVWVMNIDGTGLVNLTGDGPNNQSYDQGSPAWSPDGTKIVYEYHGFGCDYCMFTMNADGTNKLQVNNDSYVWVQPSWSPDGTKILFIYVNWDNPGTNGINIMNADGTGRTLIYPNTVNTRQPVFSTDGTKIIFARDDSNWEPVPNYQTFNIHTINADGTGDTILTSGVYDEDMPNMRQIPLITPPVPDDTTPPVITLLGTTPTSVECGTAYTDAGATASDDTDGDITASIVTGGLPINTGVLGSSIVTYDVSDAAGNAAIQVTRTVNVADTTAPSVSAALVPFGNGDDDDDEGKFIIQISGSDTCDASPTVTAMLNGIPVTNGQPVKLEIDDEAESKFKEAKAKQCSAAQKQADKRTAKGKPIGDELAWELLVCNAGGVLQMEGVSFTLTATATDDSGNSSTATASPAFAGDEDNDDEDDE